VRYWLTPAADADRDTKIADVCGVYRSAAERAQANQRTINTDELTYVRALERLAPDPPPRPGKVADQSNEANDCDPNDPGGAVDSASAVPPRRRVICKTELQKIRSRLTRGGVLAELGDIAEGAVTPQLENAQRKDVRCVRRGGGKCGKHQPLDYGIDCGRARQNLSWHDRVIVRGRPGIACT
jgi:hypothetical protein